MSRLKSCFSEISERVTLNFTRYLRTLTLCPMEVIVVEVRYERSLRPLSSRKSSEVPGTAVALDQPQTAVRRWERFLVDVRLKASFKRNGMPLTIFGRGSDVSQGGMAAYIPSELSAGTDVDLELSLPYASGEQP